MRGGPQPNSGGKRPGAGRPQGTPDRCSIEYAKAEAHARAVLGESATPLQIMLLIMRDESQTVDVRLRAAVAAAPYCHRRMPVAVEVDANVNHRIEGVTLTIIGPTRADTPKIQPSWLAQNSEEQHGQG